MSPRSELATIRNCAHVWEAEILRDRLRAAGIAAFVHGGETARSLSYIGVALGGVRVQVRAADLGRAEQVLVDDERQRILAGRWRCPRCGEPNDASFDFCYSCAMPRGDSPALPYDEEDMPRPYEGPSASAETRMTIQDEPSAVWLREDRNPYRSSAPIDASLDDVDLSPSGSLALRTAVDDGPIRRAAVLALLGSIAPIPLFPLFSFWFLCHGWRAGAVEVPWLRWVSVGVATINVVSLAVFAGVMTRVLF